MNGEGPPARVPQQLTPDALHAHRKTRWLGREIHCFASTDSTNRAATELGRSGAPHGSAVLAEEQTAGRGRLGRAFFSPPAGNLYLSCVLRFCFPPAEAPSLVLSAAVAVADSVAEVVADPAAVSIKWPNDVLLGDKKTSGILMEMVSLAGRVDFFVLGIGVNLNSAPEDFPKEFRACATSLAAYTKHAIDRAAFCGHLLQTLETALDNHAAGGFERNRERFLARSALAGRTVRVRESNSVENEGTAVGIDCDGALLLTTAAGKQLRIMAGDVTLAVNAAA